MVELFEFQELRIVQPFLDMIGQRQIMVVLFADCFIVNLHVVEDCLFVAQVIVVFHLTVIQQAVRRWILLFLILFILSFLGSASKDSTVLGCTAMRRCRVLLLELYLRVGVSEGC